LRKSTDEEIWQNTEPSFGWQEPGVHPRLEYHIQGNSRMREEDQGMPIMIRSFSEIKEDETPEDLWDWPVNESERSYKGRNIWELGRIESSIHIAIDRENNYLIQGPIYDRDEVEEHDWSWIEEFYPQSNVWNVIDLIEGDIDLQSVADDSLWYNQERYFDDVVVAESQHRDLESSQIDVEEKENINVQYLEESENYITEEAYIQEGDRSGQEISLVEDKTGIPIEDVVNDFGKAKSQY
jgi:hypothetical protein